MLVGESKTFWRVPWSNIPEEVVVTRINENYYLLNVDDSPHYGDMFIIRNNFFETKDEAIKRKIDERIKEKERIDRDIQNLRRHLV